MTTKIIPKNYVDQVVPKPYVDQVIDYQCVDVVRKNTDHVAKKYYECKKNPSETIKWCRRNFGERGDSWDFIGGFDRVTIIIWSHKLQFMYEMWYE